MHHRPALLGFCLLGSLLGAAGAQQSVSPRREHDEAATFSMNGWFVERAADGTASFRRDGRQSRPLRRVHDLLRFRAVSFDPLRAPFVWPGPLAAPAGTRLFVVQFRTQLLPVYRGALQELGVELLQVLPDNAIYVRADAATMRRVDSLPCVRWSGPLQNGFKLDAALRAFVTAGGPARACNLVLARKGDRAALVELVGSLGGEVVDLAEGSTMLRASLTSAQLLRVLQGDLVVFAEPDGGIGFDMDNARVQTGANYVETLAGYRGEGVRAEIAELFDETHADFANVPGRVLPRAVGAFSHGHCTAGIVGGSGANEPAARGMLDLCTLIEGGYYNTADHYSQLQGSVLPPWSSMQVTSSWGAAWSQDYTTISQALDDALFEVDLPRTQSQANSGTRDSRPEAWAKNGISVGSLLHGDNADPSDDVWAGSSSIGPATDGRFKPDLVAYGDAILTSDRPGTAGYDNNPGVSGDYYDSFGGTSGSTPIVNGCLGIVQEMFTDGLFGNPLPMPPTVANRFANRPHMTTARALLCNTAEQYGFSGANHDLTRAHQGWGIPSLRRLYDERDRIVVMDEYDRLSLGDTRRHLVHVAPGTAELRVTVVYNEPAGNPAAAVQLVNDLDLTVTRWSDGSVWHGNHGLDVGTHSVSGGAPNTVDNVECVYLAAPQPGLYVVDVFAASVTQDAHLETPQADVDFALVMHPMGGGYRSPGAFDLEVVSSGSGDLHFQCSNVPATGWTEGFTLISFAAQRATGFGAMFGVEPDGFSAAALAVPAAPGGLFHFTNTPGGYPFADFPFPDPGLIAALSGITFDSVVVLLQGAEVAGVSDVVRTVLP